MANAKGLKCSKSYFWKLLHNQAYCGYVSFALNGFDERQIVKGIHQPLISETLFFEVQNIINTKRKITGKAHEINETLILRRYLICPACNRKLTGSISKGKSKRFPYYHCTAGCKTRFKAKVLNINYENKLDQLRLLPGARKLLHLILEDVNINTQRNELLLGRKLLFTQIAEQELFISKARKLFVAGEIKFDDFSNLKKEYLLIANSLRDELKKVTIKLNCLEKQPGKPLFDNIISGFKNLDVNDKKHLIELIPPGNVDIHGNFSLQLHHALSTIMSTKTNSKVESV